MSLSYPTGKVINNKVLQLTGIFLCCLGLIYSLLVSPPNADITFQYYEMGFEKIIFLVCFFTLLMKQKSVWGYAVNITATISLFFLSLIYKWQSADNYFLLGGLFPQSDANDYFTDAQRLLHGFDMIGSGTYRPIYSSFLAALLKITNSNLQLILIIFVICNALAVYFAAQEINKTFKSDLASAFYIILSYMFIRRFSGTLMTENLGFCLGNLALVFLIYGLRQRKLDWLLFGIFILTTALNTRAGAFLILPTLAVWVGFANKETHGFWRSFFLVCFVILMGMFANFAIARINTSPKSTTFSNYSYTLYGLVSGNKGWEQAGKDHPEADADEIYALAIQKIVDNPIYFLLNVLGAYRDYFESSNGAFSYLLLKHDRGDIANWLLWSLTFVGVAASFINKKQNIFGICLGFSVGIFISVSMVPPADSVKMRVYAATIPMSGYIIAAGIAFIRDLLKQKKHLNIISIAETDNIYLPFSLSILLLITSFAVPIFVKWSGTPMVANQSVSCRENEQNFTVFVASGSSARLNAGNAETYIPELGISQLVKKIIRPEQRMRTKEIEFFKSIPSGTIITIAGAAMDNTTTPLTIMLVTSEMPRKGRLTICVTQTPIDNFYFADLNDNQKTVFPIKFEERFGITETFRTIQFLVLGIVFLGILIDIPHIRSLPQNQVFFVLANAAMLGSGIIFILNHFGIIPIIQEQMSIDTSRVRRQGNENLYIVDIGTNKISDTPFKDLPVGLFENNIPLGPQHESQSLIDAYGRGNYIIRNNFLFFSTSDNSDPRTNGREYTLKWPAQARLRYQIIAYAAILFGLALRNHFSKLGQSKPKE